MDDFESFASCKRQWRVLSAYAAYYNTASTHLALQKDAPLNRPIQRSGQDRRYPSLGWTALSICPDMIFGKYTSEWHLAVVPSGPTKCPL